MPLNLKGGLHRRPALVADVTALAGIVVGLLVAPETGDGSPEFFSASAQIVATFLVAAALFEGFPFGVRRVFRRRTFAWFGIGEVAAIAGTTDRLPDCLFEITFALTLGGVIGSLAAVLLAGVSNVAAHKAKGVDDALRDDPQPVDPAPPGGGPDRAE